MVFLDYFIRYRKAELFVQKFDFNRISSISKLFIVMLIYIINLLIKSYQSISKTLVFFNFIQAN